MTYGAWGPLVCRLPTTTAATIVTAGTRTLFTVTGYIRRCQLTLRVNTVIGAGATTIKLLSNPTTGAVDTDLCAVTAIENLAAGTGLGLTGVPTDQLTLFAGQGAAFYGTNYFGIHPGIISLVAAGGTTGDVIVQLDWEPGSSDAAVV